MRIAISGASGFLGSHLAIALRKGGNEVLALVRHQPGGGEIGWDPDAGTIDRERLAGIDTVIHLAGQNIATRWTDAAKRQIRESRVRGTGLLATALTGLPSKPRLLISVSAVGIYGDRGDEILTEKSRPGAGFLAEVAQAWESAAQPARDAGIRVVHPRLGMVLGPEGGALAKMLPPFRLGLGGKLGSGDQWMSWVALDDVLGAMQHIIERQELQGPINLVAPEPVENREFTRLLGQELHRPAPLTVPRFALYLRYGREMVDEVLLGSARVVPERLEETGFSFQCPTLRQALARALGS
ncbi:MAG TPA: TIGR01777 family oxidoreductase [Gemmatimonadales bacterium]|jgi:hypothetical protein|nr:TIGR01777 family oxidoreductase [Gemmatimonadales bacterium]